MRRPRRIISSSTKITIKRMLPIAGDVLVQRGQAVEAMQVVAEAVLPRRRRVLEVARQLGLSPEDMGQVMLKAEGDVVEANEVIAAAPAGRWPFSRRSLRAPSAGRIARIGPGWVLLETETETVQVRAFVNGVVAWIAPDQGVVIEAAGTLVEAACGFGGEACGPFKRLTNSPFEPLNEAALDESCRDTIILGGRTLDEAALRKAEQLQVRGIVVGSFDAGLLGLEPPAGLRLIATEGFGDLPMAPQTFGILRGLSGKEVCIRGGTPASTVTVDDPGETTPLIVAANRGAAPPSTEEVEEIQVGSKVRITRGKYLGSQATVETLPVEPQVTEAGVATSGAFVKVDDTQLFVPWANLEQLA